MALPKLLILFSLLTLLSACGRDEASLFGNWKSAKNNTWAFQQNGTCEQTFPTNYNGVTTGEIHGTCTYLAGGKFDFQETSNNVGTPVDPQPWHYTYTFHSVGSVEIKQDLPNGTPETFNKEAL